MSASAAPSNSVGATKGKSVSVPYAPPSFSTLWQQQHDEQQEALALKIANNKRKRTEEEEHKPSICNKDQDQDQTSERSEPPLNKRPREAESKNDVNKEEKDGDEKMSTPTAKGDNGSHSSSSSSDASDGAASSTGSDVVCCSCDGGTKPASIRTIRREESEHVGREFYGCEGSECSFFRFVNLTDEEKTLASHPTLRCKCTNGKMVSVRKAGAKSKNPGKLFYTCADCNFFKWFSAVVPKGKPQPFGKSNNSKPQPRSQIPRRSSDDDD